jgi:hypothetical protein
MNERIKNLLEIGRLVEEMAADEEIIGTWHHAVTALEDARVTAVSLEGRLVRAFDAGRLGAHAIVRAHNFRVRAVNHHEMTIAVAALLGGQDLPAKLQEFESLRKLRSQVEYGWRTLVGTDDLESAIDSVTAILENVRTILRKRRPSIRNSIRPAS